MQSELNQEQIDAMVRAARTGGVEAGHAMAGEDDYNYLGTQTLASAIAAGGGFGIAKLISEHFGSTKVAPERPVPPDQSLPPSVKVSITSADRMT